MSENFAKKYARLMLDGEAFDPGVEAMTSASRVTLIPAGDEIEDVLTDTVAALSRHPEMIIRGVDATDVQNDVARLRFWEQLSILHNAVAQMIRDQELILEDKLQRAANKINKEIKIYIQEDKSIAAEFNKLIKYMSRSSETRKRNKRRVVTDNLNNANNNENE
jgi:hypothetical protein